MYARITHVKMTDVKAAVERINENKHLMAEMNGWISSRIVQVSDDEVMGIGFFQTKEDYEASEEQFGKIMGVMKDFMPGPPDVKSGDVLFHHEA
tara:strand:+ start:417 stop:698 length:282 start_codon:yes stop_codon:yes gene_type:complete